MSGTSPPASEPQRVRERYAVRDSQSEGARYNPVEPAIYMVVQEMDRALIRWIRVCGLRPVETRRVLEVGCGSGSQLLRLIQLGFCPGNLVGNELLEDHAESARHRLPAATRIHVGDASELDLAEASFDVVFQSTVFTSLLDDAFQQKLADRMWSLVKPEGGILWYDFLYDNPRNPDVRGVPLRRVRALFPDGAMRSWRVTLAPPINRRVTRIHPGLYSVFNALPFLRTHVLCWIQKPA